MYFPQSFALVRDNAGLQRKAYVDNEILKNNVVKQSLCKIWPRQI